MNIDLQINNAIKILEINDRYNYKNINTLSNYELKKIYHILALNYHPDKNNHENANEIFKNINYSYNIIYNYNNSIKDTYYDINNDINKDNYDDNDNDNDSIYENLNDIKYIELINNFINIILNNQQDNIDNFKNDCLEYSSKIVEEYISNLNINIIEDMYHFINKINNANDNANANANDNGNNNSISFTTIKFLKNILNNILNKYNIYILNPTIKNIFNNDIYKLEINNEIVYVPLWHSEMNYEKNIIKIEPILDDNIYIDENNNIHYVYYNCFDYLINLIRNNISIINIVIEDRIFEIEINKIMFKQYQIYIIQNKGISQININNIFDCNKKSNIIFHIKLS